MPPLKWAGGKKQLLPQIREFYTEFSGRYYEPFVGAGAVFFDLDPVHATISDTNTELIDTFKAIRDDVEHVIELLQTLKPDEESFYKVRDWEPRTLTEAAKAARMIYLNRTCFNGLYRVNTAGYFNVPYGSYKNPRICDAGNLRAVSEVLKGVSILSEPFEKAVEGVTGEDFVYFDPPYLPLPGKDGFTNYSRDGFGIEDHERLYETALKCKETGAKVLLSQSSSPWIKDRYEKEFEVLEVKARRNINRQGSGRGEISEFLIHANLR